jgi:hypothetical protein
MKQAPIQKPLLKVNNICPNDHSEKKKLDLEVLYFCP